MCRPILVARALTLLAPLALLFPSAAMADYKETYKKGIDAAGKKNWPEVARLMREAVAEQSAEGEQIKLYGMRFETYLPHYYLGLALYQTGDCQGALQEWQTSQKQGAVKGAELKTLVQNQKTCQTRMAEEEGKKTLAQAGPAVQAAEAELGKAEEASRRVAALGAEPELAGIWQQDGGLGGSQKQANEALASARAKLEGGKKASDLGQLAEAKDLASRASQLLETVARNATARRDEARQRAAAAAAVVPTTTAPAASTQLPALPVPTRPAGPPPELVAGAQAYFDARYKEASDLLANANTSSGPAGAHTALIRAAARYALFVVGGQHEEALRQAAADDVRACRRINPRLAPDPRVFSPRFIAFFKKSR